MPVFICVQCCDCNTFQSTQKRKDKKFTCKMCGKKQSVLKEHASSESGKQIRQVVQDLNMARGTAEEEYESAQADKEPEQYSWNQSGEAELEQDKIGSSESKWAYIADRVPELAYNDEDDDGAEDDGYVTAMPESKGKKSLRGRKRGRNYGDCGDIGTSEGGASRKRASHGRRNEDSGGDGDSHGYSQGHSHGRAIYKDGCDDSEKRTRNDALDYDWGDGFVTRADDGEAFEEEVM